MKVSDELKKAIDPEKREMWIEDWGETLSRAVADALPRIVALERCREILERDNRELKTGKCKDCGCGIHYGHYKSCKDSRIVRPAKALEATP